MSAKLGAMIARKPKSSGAQGACSRLEPQPKLRRASKMVAPRYSGRFNSNFGSGEPSGNCRQSKNKNCPKPVRSIRFKNCLGMSWSVSTLARSSAATRPVWVVKGFIARLFSFNVALEFKPHTTADPSPMLHHATCASALASVDENCRGRQQLPLPESQPHWPVEVEQAA